MPLNKQKGNMYGFITHTWNTIKGKCPFNCKYCYMKKFTQNEIHFDLSELKTRLGQHNFIFVGSSCDMFANAIPSDWIQRTLAHCRKFSNQYLFQTKNPKRFFEFTDFFPPQTTLCITLESDIDHHLGCAPAPWPRCYQFKKCRFQYDKKFKYMVTIEPVLFFTPNDFYNMLLDLVPHQINIGADSGNNKLNEPSRDQLLRLIKRLQKARIYVHQKPNLKRLLNNV